MRYILYFSIPFLLSLILTPIVRFIAVRYGLVAYPRPDRWHKHPTALLGGIGIYLAAGISFFLFQHSLDKNAIILFIAVTTLFITGLIDDKFHLAPYSKLFFQIIAGCLAIFSGVILKLPGDSFIISVPLTLLWIVGVTNSFNLLDNIDGLAAGIASISSLMLFLSSLLFSNNPLGEYGLILCAATLGFLPYNFHPAKIFMGDSGSMFLGFSLSVISMSATPRHIANLFTTMFVPVFILCIPIFDTTFVMLLRKLQGKRLFDGGKDHTSHHLVSLGLTQKKTVLLLYAISIALGIIAISYSKIDVFIIFLIAFLAVIILLFFGMFLSESAAHLNKQKSRKDAFKSKTNETLLPAALLHKRRIVEVLLDLALICIAYTTAYFLRFEDSMLASNSQLIKESLVWIILIKISLFFVFGLYRGVWRYASISDMLTIFKVISIASITSIIFLTFAFRFKDYSRTVFFIDWLLLLLLVSGSRISFRILGELFSRAREKGKNILIFGAGDTGEMVIREIKRNASLNYNPVGFIDDDPAKIGNKIQGISVLGSRNKILQLVKTQRVEELIIAIPSLDIRDLSEIVKICREGSVSYRKIKGILDKEEIDEFNKN